MKSIYRDRYLFGGNREAAIQRDEEKCVKCGMTRTEHREQFGRDITVDHIDGNGLFKPRNQKNNALENLQTLCAPCHGRKDVVRAVHSSESNGHAKLTSEQVTNIRHCKGSISSRKLGDLYGVTGVTIIYIWNQKTWKGAAA